MLLMIENVELCLTIHSAVLREMFIACMQMPALAVECTTGRYTPATSLSSLAMPIRCCTSSLWASCYLSLCHQQ